MVSPNGSSGDLLPPSFRSILADSFSPGLFLSCQKSCFGHLTSGTAGLPGLEPAPGKSAAEKKVLRAQAETMGLGVGWRALGSRETWDKFLNASLDLLDGASGPRSYSFLLCYHLITSSEEIQHGNFPFMGK